eukprot:scaffold125837_cov59-Cyclotella_meneghiniana.AAC.2
MGPNIHFTAAWLFQYLMSILNGKTRWRLEFIGHKARHKLTFELQMKTILVCDESPLLSHQDCVCDGTQHPFHSSLAVPMSHHKYFKWQD